ncbi:MAG: SDR family oxidoreductase [Chitinophagaceae bacterium]|nr:SDR family oxidoreductase [Chitinophagaceae bacterium]
MLLTGKNAIVYGAGGSLGGAIAKAWAREGAYVFLTGRNPEPLEAVYNEIIGAGGNAEMEVVDAMEEKEVTVHLDRAVDKKGSVDLCFNAIGMEDRQDVPLTEIPLDDFIRPIRIAMQSNFLTATACGRIMMRQKKGVIVTLTATPGGIGYPMVGGFGPACAAIERFSIDLAAELGIYGVRVVNMRSGGSPDSRVFKEAIAAGGPEIENALNRLKGDTMLKELPLMNDIANLAVFLGSDMAAKITGVTVDITGGTCTSISLKDGYMLFK